MRNLPLIALALPAATLAATCTVFVALAAAERHPLWASQPLNMSEAAALRDAATVLRRLRAGEGAGERRSVRAGYLFDRPVTATPLQAAVAAKRPEIVELLLEAGAATMPDEWVSARCLAARAREAELERLLDAYQPAGTTTRDCADEAVPW